MTAKHETITIRKQLKVGDAVRFKGGGTGNLGNQDPTVVYTVSGVSPHITYSKMRNGEFINPIITQCVTIKERRFVSIGELFTAEYLDIPEVTIPYDDFIRYAKLFENEE